MKQSTPPAPLPAWDQSDGVWCSIHNEDGTLCACAPPTERGRKERCNTWTTFEEAWAAMERAGYQYGEDALEHVRFGWELSKEAIDGLNGALEVLCGAEVEKDELQTKYDTLAAAALKAHEIAVGDESLPDFLANDEAFHAIAAILAAVLNLNPGPPQRETEVERLQVELAAQVAGNLELRTAYERLRAERDRLLGVIDSGPAELLRDNDRLRGEVARLLNLNKEMWARESDANGQAALARKIRASCESKLHDLREAVQYKIGLWNAWCDDHAEAPAYDAIRGIADDLRAVLAKVTP